MQLFPEGTSFDNFSDEQLQVVVDLINNVLGNRQLLRTYAELLFNFL